MEKKILIAVPNDFGLPQRFKENFEFHGFKVDVVPFFKGKMKLSIIHHIIHNIKKIFFQDKTYKDSTRDRLIKDFQYNLIKKNNTTYDYAFVIRPDFFSKKTIELIVSIVAFSVGYQWDGMDRYPDAKKYVDYFDIFYVFDKEDVNEKQIATTNFYFDDLSMNSSPIYDVCFVGSKLEERLPIINKLSDIFQSLSLKTSLNIIDGNKQGLRVINGVNFRRDVFDFKQNIELVLSSKIILDLQNSVHQGLSLRVFESLGYEKKLITTNPFVKDCIFYHPNNMLVIDENSNSLFTDISNFIKLPYHKIDPNIRKKYSFGHWIKEKLK